MGLIHAPEGLGRAKTELPWEENPALCTPFPAPCSRGSWEACFPVFIQGVELPAATPALGARLPWLGEGTRALGPG